MAPFNRDPSGLRLREREWGRFGRSWSRSAVVRWRRIWSAAFLAFLNMRFGGLRIGCVELIELVDEACELPTQVGVPRLNERPHAVEETGARGSLEGEIRVSYTEMGVPSFGRVEEGRDGGQSGDGEGQSAGGDVAAVEL